VRRKEGRGESRRREKKEREEGERRGRVALSDVYGGAGESRDRWRDDR
jgi:hypothetical protein